MNKIVSFALASSLALAATSAFAGGMTEVSPEPPIAVVPENTSSSATPLWAVIGGAVVLCAVACGGDSSSSTNGTNEATAN